MECVEVLDDLKVEICFRVELLYLGQSFVLVDVVQDESHCRTELCAPVTGLENVLTSCKNVLAAHKHIDQQLLLGFCVVSIY